METDPDIDSHTKALACNFKNQTISNPMLDEEILKDLARPLGLGDKTTAAQLK